MKKLILALALACLGASAHAQTASDVLAAVNSATCERFGLATGCSDAAVLTAYCDALKLSPCTDTRKPEDKVYATAAAYAAAVLLPPKQAEVFASRRNQIIERLVRRVLADPKVCVGVMTAAALDTAVCK